MASSKPSRSLFSIVLILYLFFTLASCTPTPVAAPVPDQTQELPGQGLTWETAGATPGEIVCATDRSSDYYGLGVRLGIYMAWFTGWIANIGLQDEIAGSMDTNSIFLFALIIAMVRCTITNLVSRLDALMLMHLSGGTVFSVISIWGYRTCVYRNEGPRGIRNFGGFGTHLRLLLCMAVSCYGFWFWYYGIMGSLETGPDNCAQVYTFLFAKLRADGGIRIYYIFICISCMIYFGIMTAVSIVGPLSRICKITWLAKYRFYRTTSRLKFATGLEYKQLCYIFYFLAVGNFIWIVFSMVTCEFTLNYNHVKEVLGENGRIFFPSQLIPMVIGACGLVRVSYLRIGQWRSPTDSKPSLDSVPSTPTRKVTLPKGKSFFKIFAPATQYSASGHLEGEGKRPNIEDDKVDEEMVGKPTWWRYLVSWLPWLQAATQWWKTRNDPSSPTHRNIHGNGEKLVPTTTLEMERDLEKGRDERRETWQTDQTLTAQETRKSKQSVP